MSGPRFRRTVRWQRLDPPGMEKATLFSRNQMWRIRGTLETRIGGTASKTSYEVVCDSAWATRAAYVWAPGARLLPSLSLIVDRGGRWFRDGHEVPALEHSTDVDLEISPSTNTLPIRRLNLKEGEGKEIRVAWVRLARLAVEPADQRYTRVGARRYRFDDLTSNYTVEIEVDDASLVVDYPGGWRRAPVLSPNRVI